MKFLFWFIIKQFYDLGYKLGILDINDRRRHLKYYYREKMFYYSIWHHFRAKKRTIQYFNSHIKDADTVIYTCLTGGYDELLTPNFINPNCDYVCFTDDEKLIKKSYVGPWKIEKLQFSELDNGKNNRWHKMHPHLLFPNYNNSIYIDANVNFKTDKIFEYIRALPSDCFIALSPHPERDCIYDEAEIVLEGKLDKPEKVYPLMEKYRAEGFPKHFGLAENNVIFRHHNHPECIKLMDEWWDLFLEHSRRDQLSLFYLFWKNNTNYAFFSSYPFKKDHKNFRMYKHKG